MFKLMAGAAVALVGMALVAQASSQPADSSASAPEAEAKEAFVYVHLTTTKGDIFLELNTEKAPISVENFVTYTNDKAYDGTIFHRVIPNFMIQGGGFNPDMTQRKTRDAIKNEWKNGLKNEKYTVAMARTSVPDSATSQFFINVKDNMFLSEADPSDPRAARFVGYAVFGKVVKGFEVVDAIKVVETKNVGRSQGIPVEPVIIKTAVVLTEEQVEEHGLVSDD